MQQQTIDAVVINRIMQVGTSVTDDDTLFSRDSASTCAPIPQIVTRATHNNSAVRTRSHPTYDHHRNVVHE